MNYTKVKQSIKQHGTHLKGFVFQLALSLIKSADKRMYYVDNMNAALDLIALSFQQDESTLMEQLSQVKWPKRFKIKHFNKNRNLIELCLTCSKNIKHEVIQLVSTHEKNHCSFCYTCQTTYGCNLCKVILCKTARKGSTNTVRAHSLCFFSTSSMCRCTECAQG
jgi:hypothetical protein